MIARFRVIAGQEQYVADAKDRRAQQIRLQREAVAVAARHLQDRIHARIEDHLGHRQRAGAHDGAGAVRHVDRVDKSFHALDRLEDLGEVGALRRVHLHRHEERLLAQFGLEPLRLQQTHADPQNDSSRTRLVNKTRPTECA